MQTFFWADVVRFLFGPVPSSLCITILGLPVRVLLQHDERGNAGQVVRSFSRRAAGGEF